jgi:hypothetical protein
VALVRTDVSEEPGASFIRVTKIGELRTSVLTRATRRNNPEDIILHGLRMFENRVLRRTFGPKGVKTAGR